MLRRFFHIVLLPILFTSFTGFAEALPQAEHNAFFHCKHTRQKIERTKHCPCGCNKKKRSTLRLSSGHESCDADDVVAQLPSFAKLSADISGVQATTAEILTQHFFICEHFPAGVNLPSSSPPG